MENLSLEEKQARKHETHEPAEKPHKHGIQVHEKLVQPEKEKNIAEKHEQIVVEQHPIREEHKQVVEEKKNGVPRAPTFGG
jgi:hypothetical protein